MTGQQNGTVSGTVNNNRISEQKLSGSSSLLLAKAKSRLSKKV